MHFPGYVKLFWFLRESVILSQRFHGMFPETRDIPEDIMKICLNYMKLSPVVYEKLPVNTNWLPVLHVRKNVINITRSKKLIGNPN